MRHVIIGAGPAGIWAARTLRSLNKEDKITLISNDDAVHARSLLYRFISGERDEQGLRFIPPDFFEANGIEWLSGAEVLAIGTKSRTVMTSRGDIPYDRLLIATGSNSVIPPVGRLREAPNVFTLRHLSDARAIVEAAKGARDIVVIGAGLVGLDAAYALLSPERKITVVEMGPRILPLNLDDRAAAVYQRLFEARGCEFRLGAAVADTAGDGALTELILSDGERLKCDFVIVAAGVRPAVGMLAGSGIDHDRLIPVDGHMRTNIPEVYAAGDVTGLSGIWPNAAKQGETAAVNMCGGEAVYTDTFAAKSAVTLFGLAAISLGRVDPEPGDEVHVREDRHFYGKLILNGGRVKGVILQGDVSYAGFWQHLIKNEIDVSHCGDLWSLGYADFFKLNSAGEYCYSAPA